MKFDIKAQKLMIVGINGSGKSNAGYYIASKQFRRFILLTPHQEDLKTAPKNAIPVLAVDLDEKELDSIFEVAKQLANERKIDGIMVDDLDVFIKDEADLKKCPHLKDALINHRHWGKKNKEDKNGLGIIFMSRRPQNVPASLFEICEYNMIFSSPTSDNVKRKYNAIHEGLYEQVQTLKYKEYKFVVKKVGEVPQVLDPLPLHNATIKTTTKSKEKKSNGLNSR